jgi:hypothetical protein
MQTVTLDSQALAPASFDVAYAIPSCNEGRVPLKMLASIALQKDVEDTRTAIVLVINHRRSAGPDVAASNARTRALVEAAWAGTVPDDLATDETIDLFKELNVPNFQALSEALRTRKRIELVLVDMHTEGNAPEVCNVGIARRIGCAQAVTLLKAEGILVCTDADSWLTHEFERTMLDLYDDPAVQAAAGTVTYMPDLETLNVDKLRDVENALRVAQNIVEYTRDPRLMPSETGPSDNMMPGVLMTMRRGVYEKTGGFDDMPGAEDTALSCKILNAGYHIADGEMRLMTPNRVSDRTHENHGLGQAFARIVEFNERPDEFPVRPIRSVRLNLLLRAALEDARTAPDEAAWTERMRRVRFDGFEAGDPRGELTELELKRLWNDFQRAPKIAKVSDNGFIWLTLRNICDDRFGSLRMDLALMETEGVMLDFEEERGDDSAERAQKLFRQDDDVVEQLQDFAERRVGEEMATDRRRGVIALSMFGLSEDPVRERIEDMDIRANQLHAMALVQHGCLALLKSAADLRAVAPEPQLQEDAAQAGMLLKELALTTAAGWQILARGLRYERGTGAEDVAELKRMVAERLTMHGDMLDGLRAELGPRMERLGAALTGMTAAAGPDAETVEGSWKLLELHWTSSGQVRGRWGERMDKWK